MKAFGWAKDASKLTVVKNVVPSWVTSADYLYVSMHYGSIPQTTDDQTTSEMTYSGYARQPIQRVASKWTLIEPGGTPPYYRYTDAITFPAPVGSIPSGQEVCTHLAIGLNETEAGTRLLVSEVYYPSGVTLVVGSTITVPANFLRVMED